MKVKMKDKDGVVQGRFINPKNFDPDRMEVLDHTHPKGGDYMTSKDSSSAWEEVVEFWKKSSQNRYKWRGRYKFDRYLFTGSMLLIFAWLWFIAHSYNYDLNYYQCITPAGQGTMFPDGTIEEFYAPEGCRNPFYKPITWRNQEYLPPGEYGTKPGPLYYSAMYITIILLALAFGLNHLIHNIGRKIKTRRKRT